MRVLRLLEKFLRCRTCCGDYPQLPPLQTHELNPAQLRQFGIEALVQALGAVGMVRFLQQFDRGTGDYTCDRDTISAGITLEAAILQGRGDANAQIKQAREGKG